MWKEKHLGRLEESASSTLERDSVLKFSEVLHFKFATTVLTKKAIFRTEYMHMSILVTQFFFKKGNCIMSAAVHKANLELHLKTNGMLVTYLNRMMH